jgi:integrase
LADPRRRDRSQDPQVRDGSSFPSFLEPRRRAERALLAVLLKAYIEGVSTRKVGRKDRTTYLDGGAAAARVDWLVVRGADAGPLLCPVNKTGKITIQLLSDQAVLGALQKRAKQATVKAFSPHDLRRTFISDLLDAGADIATVQRMAGHASPETASRYDRRGEATKRRAASLLHLAYDSRTGSA